MCGERSLEERIEIEWAGLGEKAEPEEERFLEGGRAEDCAVEGWAYQGCAEEEVVGWEVDEN